MIERRMNSAKREAEKYIGDGKLEKDETAEGEIAILMVVEKAAGHAPCLIKYNVLKPWA